MDARTVGGVAALAVVALLLVPTRRAADVESDPVVRALVERELLIATNTEIHNPMAPLGRRAKPPRRLEIRSLVARRSAVNALFGLRQYGVQVEFADGGLPRCGKLNLERSAVEGRWIARRARASSCDAWF